MKLRVHQTLHVFYIKIEGPFWHHYFKGHPHIIPKPIPGGLCTWKDFELLEFSVWWNAQNLQVFATSGNFFL